MGKQPLTAQETAILSKLPVDALQELAKLRDSGKLFMILYDIVNMVIDVERNYSFALNEDPELPVKHAYSRGKAAFGTSLIHLIQGAPVELARRERLQEEIRAKQGQKGE